MDLDFFDVLDAMSFQYHEHHDAILGWSWKVFCVKLSRLIGLMDKQRAKEEQAKVEAAYAELEQAHKMRGAGGGGEAG